MEETRREKIEKVPEMFVDKITGWSLFTPEVAWYVYDFFKHELTPFEKLIFFGYYINGMTLMDIAERVHCTFQNIGVIIKKIEKRLHLKWKHRKNWEVNRKTR